MKRILLIVAPVLFISLLLAHTGCQKSDNQPVSFIDSGMLYFHLHTYLDTNEVKSYGTVYTTSTGRKISLTQAQLYISNIQLVKLDGSFYNITRPVLLQRHQQEDYFIAKVPVGSFKGVRFGVGFDSLANTRAADTDTALNHPDMWLDNTAQPAGYIFVSMQGRIDTTAAATGSEAQMQPFTYRLGTYGHYRQVVMPDHSPYYKITKGQATYVHIAADYSRLFTNIPLDRGANLIVVSAADNASVISDTLSNNILRMFSYEL